MNNELQWTIISEAWNMYYLVFLTDIDEEMKTFTRLASQRNEIKKREHWVQKISAQYPCWSVIKSIPQFLPVGAVLQFRELYKLFSCLLGLLASRWLWPVGSSGGGEKGRVRDNSVFPSFTLYFRWWFQQQLHLSEAPFPTRQPLHGLSFFRASCTEAPALTGWLSLLHSGEAISPVVSPAVGETVFLQLLFFRLTLHPVWLFLIPG